MTVPLLERSLLALDWPRLVLLLAERASTGFGEERCQQIAFLPSAAEARDALAAVGEMMALLADSAAPSLGGLADVRSSLVQVSKGQVLDGPTLLQLAHTLEALERLKNHLSELSDQAPRLCTMAAAIQPHPDLAAWLVGSFDPRGDLSSSTYPQLSGLRSAKSRLHSKIRSTLDGLKKEMNFGSALQDDFIALRNDRYVVPLKAEEKRSGFGIVHDTSGSGQTVFVEPLQIVELNNELKMADAELRQEELRILRDLSERVALVAWDFTESLSAAADLDLVLANALLSVDLDSTVPAVSDEPLLVLRNLRHPLLVLQGVDVVPNDLQLGGDRRALVLSGANTGGKTVTLKALGLAVLLVRAGIPLPADEGSRIGWFDQVLTDIGDAQDVARGLSTFSGHVLCLAEILEDLRERAGVTLVLVDEIASGTDPVQGAALGRAVLEALVAPGALVATTTHYPELKALSAVDSRFANARVEFDDGQGVPTYRVSVGRPGSSHALDIAARVGLEASIIETARGFLDRTSADVEKLLGGLETELEAARCARSAAEEERALVSEELAAARATRAELRRRSSSIQQELRGDFEREVRGYRDAVRAALKQIEKGRDTASVEQARRQISEGAAELRSRLPEEEPASDSPGLDSGALELGAWVRVVSLGKDGQVVGEADKRGRVHVEVDGMRIRVAAGGLAPAPSGGQSPARGKGARGRSKVSTPMRSPSPEQAVAVGDTETAFRSADNTLDLRGERVDDALEAVERFLDESLLAGRPFAFVLHGLGTGALRKAIRESLRSSRYVDTFSAGTRSQGGEGITVVKLRGD
ncbi:MAG: Smr/MutS family protein [Myxococcota bacterium]|nr:Smr/MutS family protein [Myxococcota bacterium]